jgi:hypothetical protein
MAKKRWTPEEREAFRQQKLEWERERAEFAEIVERWRARLRAADERRERRRRLVRRALRLGRA